MMLPGLAPISAETPPGAVDLLLGAAVLITASAALFPRARIAQAMGFLCLGVVMTLLWLRLDSVDVGLAEAALGTGLLSALLVWLATAGPSTAGPDSADAPGHHRTSRPGRTLRPVGAVMLGAVLTTTAAAAWLGAEQTLPQWEEPVEAGMPETGVTHEVTGVLLAFRAYDTLLESAVLMLAGVAVLTLSRDLAPPGPSTTPAARASAPASTLTWWARASAPALLMLGIWLLFAGSSESGGAFQAGAVLAGMLILLHASGAPAPRGARTALPVLLVIGVVVFILAGTLGPVIGEPWLSWDTQWAFGAVLTVEIMLTLGIAAALHLLYLGLLEPKGVRR